jgi:hypothetical protein
VRRARTRYPDDGLVAPTAAELVLESIFEADCEGVAYGDRPRRSGIDRVKEVHGPLCRGYTDTVDADLWKYLDRCFILHRLFMRLG